MKSNISLITDLRDFRDDILVRKALECRRQARGLRKYPEADVLRACEDLYHCAKRMEDELERRALPGQRVHAAAKRDD